jgi:hypothetical protein
MQQSRIDDAEQRSCGGNPDRQRDDSGRGKPGAPAQSSQCTAEVDDQDVQQHASSATSAKEPYHSDRSRANN